MTTDQKGTIAETSIIAAAVKLGVGVLKPVNDGLRYDLVFDIGSRLWRIQCKWAVRYEDVVHVRCYSCRRTADGVVRKLYTRDEIDAYAAYCLELDRCWFLPIDDFPGNRQVQLRLKPTRNNQSLKINWAEDFDLAAKLRRLGAVAQLGERAAGSR